MFERLRRRRKDETMTVYPRWDGKSVTMPKDFDPLPKDAGGFTYNDDGTIFWTGAIQVGDHTDYAKIIIAPPQEPPVPTPWEWENLWNLKTRLPSPWDGYKITPGGWGHPEPTPPPPPKQTYHAEAQGKQDLTIINVCEYDDGTTRIILSPTSGKLVTVTLDPEQMGELFG
jgi:hypothetical protein